MKKRNIILIGIFLIMISLILPTGILYLLEDMNTDALHDTLTDILNDKKAALIIKLSMLFMPNTVIKAIKLIPLTVVNLPFCIIKSTIKRFQ